jgi:Papain family cysteine protease
VVEFFEKKSAVGFHRRRFLKTATAAAGGALLPQSVWSAGPPQTYNLRDDGGKNYITAVKDQEDPVPCNACTAFAVAAAVEGTFNKFNLQSGTPSVPPTSPKLDAMELFLRTSSGPYDVGSGGCGTSHWWPKYALARCQSPAPGLLEAGSSPATYKQIKGFKNLLAQGNPNPIQNLADTQENMRCWIHSKGPVLAVMVQYEDLYAWGKNWSDAHPDMANPHVYAPGAMLPVCDTTASAPAKAQPLATSKRPRVPIVGGHVVAIVGYNNPKKYWICKNSWGADWNGDGFVLIEQGSAGGSGPIGVGGCYIDLIDVWGVYFDNDRCP